MIKKIRNTITTEQRHLIWRVRWLVRRRFTWAASVARWCWTLIAGCFGWLCFIVKWLHSLFMKHILDRLLILLILVGGIVMLAFAVILILEAYPTFRVWWYSLGDNKRVLSENFYALLRNLIWSIGGVGAAIGLWFATQRQKTFSEQVQSQVDQVQVQVDQVQVQVDQGFNDRLGRGVELLAKEDMLMRCAGIQILKDLVENANDRQKPIVAKIVYEFFCDNARVEYDSYGNQYARYEENSIQDLQDALELLVNLPLDVRAKLRVNRKGQLDFRFLDFSYLILKCEKLEQVDFSNSCFFKAKFFISNLEKITFKDANFWDMTFDGVWFMNVDFMDVNFTYILFNNVQFVEVNFRDVFFRQTPFRNVDLFDSFFRRAHFTNADFMSGEFDNVDFIKSKFMGVEFNSVDINGVEFTDVNIDDVTVTDVRFREVDFLRGRFYGNGEIMTSSYLSFPYFVGTDFGVKKFTLDANVDLGLHFQLCYCDESKWSSGAYNPIDKNRRYKKGEHGHDAFVKSNKNLSEQPVQEWVAVEYAQWKLARATKKDIANLERELEKAKKSLREIQEELNLPKKTPKPKPKAKKPRLKKPNPLTQ